MAECALVPPSAEPGWARGVRRKGWGAKTKRAATQEPSGPLLEAVSSSGVSRCGRGPGPGSGFSRTLAPRALCTPRVWGASSRRMHPSPSPGVGGGLLTCYEHNV